MLRLVRLRNSRSRFVRKVFDSRCREEFKLGGCERGQQRDQTSAVPVALAAEVRDAAIGQPRDTGGKPSRGYGAARFGQRFADVGDEYRVVSGIGHVQRGRVLIESQCRGQRTNRRRRERCDRSRIEQLVAIGLRDAERPEVIGMRASREESGGIRDTVLAVRFTVGRSHGSGSDHEIRRMVADGNPFYKPAIGQAVHAKGRFAPVADDQVLAIRRQPRAIRCRPRGKVAEHQARLRVDHDHAVAH